MKKLEIIGETYLGYWNKSRTSCRAVVLQGNQLLCSYEIGIDQWVIPGGGLEENETVRECCEREVAEETGLRITASECVLQIDEYYETYKQTALYFIGTVVGTAERHLTESETVNRLEPRWKDVTEMRAVFGAYAEKDEVRRRTYLREYTALCEIFAHRPPKEIRTERLLLRAIRVDDAESVYDYAADPGISMMLYYPHDSEDETKAFTTYAEGQWNMAFPQIFSYVAVFEGKIIGGVDLEVVPDAPDTYELGWVIGSLYRNRGFATEAALALMQIAFGQLSAEKVIAHCDAQNLPSARVMQKIGMKLIHSKGLRTYPKTGRVAIEHTYALTKDDALPMPKMQAES